MSQIKTGNQVFTSPSDIAETFNKHFTNIGQSLAREIPRVGNDPLSYVNPVNGIFSFQRIDAQKVIKSAVKLLKAIDVGKATGLDKIPNRLLKTACNMHVISAQYGSHVTKGGNFYCLSRWGFRINSKYPVPLQFKRLFSA